MRTFIAALIFVIVSSIISFNLGVQIGESKVKPTPPAETKTEVGKGAESLACNSMLLGEAIKGLDCAMKLDSKEIRRGYDKMFPGTPITKERALIYTNNLIYKCIRDEK